MNFPEKNNPPKKAQNFPVVGIGASAGGLDAFKKMLTAIPEDSEMAYVVVQHLSPDYPSNLPEILAQHTILPVHEIINDINLAPNHVYIIPENTLVITHDGVLKLKQRTRSERRNNSIDIFFESLAEVHKTFAIGIILSGTAFDGTAGLKKIKELGGATIAQDPETAAFKGMPQNAIEAEVIDYIVAPENIPSRLLEIQKSYITNYAYTEEEHIPKNEEGIIFQIINLIFLRTGNDFRNYKQPTIRRRIARRMVILRKDTIEDYYNFLNNDKNEQDSLFNDLLIPVTYFFRDEKSFESLPKIVFPLILQNISNNTLRIWVAGCATGEEAYSLAISIHEYLTQTNNKDIKVQIFASDISEKCITKARAAIYSHQDVQQISEERLRNYFTRRDGHYHINKIIRDMCIFAVHNFIKDSPFAKIDLVTCRNVLIYFNQLLQNKVLTAFHYSLKEKGLLFLGKSETATNAQNLFENIGKQEKIYIRKFAPGRYLPEAFKRPQIDLNKVKPEEIKNTPQTDFRKIASDILFSDYTPASVIINEHLEIVHFHGDTSPFLSPSPGKPNFDILKMAREGISFELRNAIIKVKNEKVTIQKNNIKVKNKSYLASFEILPLQHDNEYLMVLFYKKEIPDAVENSLNIENSDQKRNNELEKEISQMREDIKRVTEEQQTVFEELQTTNEELLSSSEELQALNEELETSTEELQSNNEELMCVNDELMDRQEQLISTRNYSESIIQTIREPLLIIDKGFIIRSANPAFYKYFNTTENETVGFSFFEIGKCQWNVPEFRQKIYNITQDKIILEDFKVDTVCTDIGKKIMMVNARPILNSKPEGMILLALEDITDLVSANELLTAKNSELQKYNEQLETFTSAASHDLQEPLRKIHMFSKIIFENEKNLSETGKHHLERVLFSATNMSQLITDLINYSRINFIEKEYKKTDMNLLLKKTLADLKDTINEKNAAVSVGSFPQLNVIPYQMQQLFTNLIMNSIKYAKDGVAPEIKIETIEATKHEIDEIGEKQEMNYVKISVADNGIGFGKDYEKRIFDPFYRLHNNDQYSGSGLGLTLVKKIVANHKGFIKASSKLNLGTKMFIYIPL
ncbi:CheR family methyltransferase [Flavobacterium sp.]|uniref:CheR family methyltransferase n=1 Tax=Flavobacterium sp. TaxID=239 RepID=UPI00326732E7